MSDAAHAEIAREMGHGVQHRLAGIAARGGDLQRAHRLAGATADDVGEGAADIDADIDRRSRVGHARAIASEWFDAWIARQGCGRAGCQPWLAMTESAPRPNHNEASRVPDEGFQPTTAPIHVAQAPSARRTLVLAACLMATFMAAVESSIVATAMPTIVADLGGFNLFSWVFAVYLLTQAVSIPVYGRLADIYGRKKVFYAGAGLFLVGSTLCGFAGNMVTLILFRALQGFGAGGVQPIATTILGDIYTPTERAHVQGLVSSVFGVAAVLGPLLGAFLVEQVSWQLVFWVNLPIGVAAIVMIATFLTEPAERHRRRRIDYLGSLLLMVAITALMLVLVQGGSLSHATLAIVGARRDCRPDGTGGAREPARRSRCCRWSSGGSTASSWSAVSAAR